MFAQHQRRKHRRDEQCRARRLRADETTQRREAPDPRGALGEQRGPARRLWQPRYAARDTEMFGHEGVAGEVEDSTRGCGRSVGCLPTATPLGTEWVSGWHVPITRQVTLGGSIRISASRHGMVGKAARGKLGLNALRW
jgi:hypothetical protein